MAAENSTPTNPVDDLGDFLRDVSDFAYMVKKHLDHAESEYSVLRLAADTVYRGTLRHAEALEGTPKVSGEAEALKTITEARAALVKGSSIVTSVCLNLPQASGGAALTDAGRFLNQAEGYLDDLQVWLSGHVWPSGQGANG